MKTSILTIFFLATPAFGRQGFGPTEQEWGYVTVREGAHMFWWLHQTSANVTNYTEKPLVIWLQGGPGSSSSGYGNFAELGPLDEYLQPRPYTWINNYNVLFVDNPVGTGFSYVDTDDAYVTTNRQIAEDFVVFLQEFYETISELKRTPLYIFCESYGGKMTAEIALVVDQAIKNNELDIQLLGVGLGDSWISPLDSVLTWAPYLLAMGAVDQNGFEKVQTAASATKIAFDNGFYRLATSFYVFTEAVIGAETADVGFYNILTKRAYERKRAFAKLVQPVDETGGSLTDIMNNQVKEALGLDVEWEAQADYVFSYLREDFMKPVTDIVEMLLNTTDIRVGIYNGQLDLIVDTLGTVEWVDKLQFDGAGSWKTAERSPLVADNIIEGYYKKVGNLAFYWVNRAGHMVPADNPAAMNYILNDVIYGEW